MIKNFITHSSVFPWDFDLDINIDFRNIFWKYLFELVVWESVLWLIIILDYSSVLFHNLCSFLKEICWELHNLFCWNVQFNFSRGLASLKLASLIFGISIEILTLEKSIWSANLFLRLLLFGRFTASLLLICIKTDKLRHFIFFAWFLRRLIKRIALVIFLGLCLLNSICLISFCLFLFLFCLIDFLFFIFLRFILRRLLFFWLFLCWNRFLWLSAFGFPFWLFFLDLWLLTI